MKVILVIACAMEWIIETDRAQRLASSAFRLSQKGAQALSYLV
jgi:hypothetical protein